MADDILDHPLIAQRSFFPRHSIFTSPPLIVASGDAKLACSLHVVAPGAPTVVFFHGNGEVVADYVEGFPERFLSLGWNLLLAEYRGYGMSMGEPRLGRMLDDVPQIVAAAAVPPERLVVFGRSIGSLFAIEAAARFPALAGLILESGIAEPLERILQHVHAFELCVSPDALSQAFASRLDHRRKVATYRGPMLLLHTIEDGLVPVDNSERLASWAGGPARLLRFELGDHNTILLFNERAYFDAVAGFLSAIARQVVFASK